jgi:hypothetical protein
MGYDTAGLIKFAQDPSHHPEDLLHGFYFDNSIDTTDPPVPNVPNPRNTGVYLEGFARLEASAVVTISGGLYANLSFELANTDASPHVYLDSMIQNLESGGKVFNAKGKFYAAANMELTLPNPVGPDITLFSYDLAHYDIINNDPPPPPDLGIPVVVHDSTIEHTFALDVNKMSPGAIVTVAPFHDFPTASGFAADGIRVDYPNEIDLYVARKDDVNTDYYNFIGLNGTVPDGVTINISDPFRVFADEGAPNPAPAQTKPGVLLAGGKNVVYIYDELFDGSHATVLLVGGYGSNTLAGGTIEFGNFIPAERIDQAKSHFGDISGYDAAGQALINSEIGGATAPADAHGIIGATMTASHGGLMLGGPGANSFIAAGPGAYEMIGGPWVDSFTISPSFGGVPATYAIDGGAGGGNTLTVYAPAGDMADFESGTAPDKYDPSYKSLAVYSNAGLFATAHGIQRVFAVGAPGSTTVFGDTSELNIDFKFRGSGKLVFGGSPAPDAFDVSATYNGPFYTYATAQHRPVAQIWPFDPSGYSGGDNDFVPGNFYVVEPGTGGYTYEYVHGPFYHITRTFGTNGHTQTIEMEFGDVGGASLTLDGRGASDQYHVASGLGTFIDITIDDTDPTTQNSATVDARQIATSGSNVALLNREVTITDNSIHVDYYTPIQLVPVTFTYPHEYHFYFGSVHYSPTVYFGANTDITFAAAQPFDQTIIDRPFAPQAATIHYDGVYTYADAALGYYPLYEAMDTEEQNPTLMAFLAPGATRPIDVQHNGGNLSIDLSGARPVDLNVDSNAGTLSLTRNLVWSGDVDDINVSGSTGTLNVEYITTGTYSYYGYTGLTHQVNVLANSGTINMHDAVSPSLFGYGIDAQVNVGNGSLDSVHGTINLRNENGHYGLKIDDTAGTSTGRTGTIDATKTQIGDLTIDYSGVNAPLRYFDSFSTYEADVRSANATYIASTLPPFYSKSLNGGPLLTWLLSAPGALAYTDGDSVNEAIGIFGDPGGTVAFSATGLPPGLSIDPATGTISGTIPVGSWRPESDPYQSTVSALANGIGRIQTVTWFIDSGIAIHSPFGQQALGYEGLGLGTEPITTTNKFNQPVTLSVTGLPPGLSFDPNTATVNGTIAIGAAQNGPYYVNIHATDGVETADLPVVLSVTGIRFTQPGNQVAYVADSIHLPIDASTASGASLSFEAQNLPDGLSIDPVTGIITGAPTSVAGDNKSYYSTITVRDRNDVRQFSVQWSIIPAGLSNYIAIHNPGPQTNQAGEYAGLMLLILNSLNLPLTFTVTGLPPGLCFYPESNSIGGQVDANAATGSPYHVHMVATDGRWSGETSFDWNVTPASTVQLNNPGLFGSVANAPFDAFVYATSSLNEPLTYTAVGLPPGLSIDPPTGEITGTTPLQAASPSIFQVTATATAASGSDTKTFLWYVYSDPYSNVVTLPNPADGNPITITSQQETTLSASISPNAGVAPPTGINFPFGYLSFEIGSVLPGAAVDLTISGLDLSQITDYYKYGATPNAATDWYSFSYDQQTGTGVEIVGGDIVLHLVDGARGDDDLAQNGVVFDIGGPVITGTSQDNDPPTASIVPVAHDPRTTAVDTITIEFSEAITGLDLGDLSLTRNGGTNLLLGSGATLTTSDNVTWELGSLSGLTRKAGTYVLTLPTASSGITDLAGNSLAADASDAWLTNSTIAGRHVFYNNSKFDGNDPAANAADDPAIDAAKEALLPGGGKAAFKNYTSFSRGLNGIMIDIAGLPVSTLDPADFTFKYGNDDTPGTWATAANPTTIAVRPGSGDGGSDRITLVWADHAIPNANWLQVTVLANEHTGLAANDVFYFGSAIGETGNSLTDAKVNSQDVTRIRNNYTGFGSVGIESVYDINRDTKVNSQDVTICRNYYSGFGALKLITPPVAAPSPAGDPALIAAGAVTPSANSAQASHALAGAVLAQDEVNWALQAHLHLAWTSESERMNPKEKSSDSGASTEALLAQVFGEYGR